MNKKIAGILLVGTAFLFLLRRTGATVPQAVTKWVDFVPAWTLGGRNLNNRLHLLLAIIEEHSGGEPNTVRERNGKRYGLTGVTPKMVSDNLGMDVTPEALLNPVENLYYGLRVLDTLWQRFPTTFEEIVVDSANLKGVNVPHLALSAWYNNGDPDFDQNSRSWRYAWQIFREGKVYLQFLDERG